MVKFKNYILMGREGFLSEALGRLRSHGLEFSRGIRIIHSLAENGPKLVKVDDRAARELGDRLPDVRRLPVIKYARPLMKASYPLAAPGIKGRPVGGEELEISVKETRKGKQVACSDVVVTAFSDYRAKIGDRYSTDRYGRAFVTVSGDTINHLYGEALWKWSAFREDVPLNPPITLHLPPLSEDFTDCVRHYYDRSRFNPDIPVTVGVIDTGVGPHDDLNIVGGHNITPAPGQNYNDVGDHGTFVAGLIGSKGDRYRNLRGLAPGVRLQSYRVYEGFPFEVTSYTVARAIDKAVSDECDILNLSIESTEEDAAEDEALKTAIALARDNGMIVVVAAGNDGRKRVDYPASYPGATAVSAMGCEDFIPPDALEWMAVGKRKGNDPKEFIAAFSNFGDKISVTALGLGVLSTLPENKFGSCSGTSMAAPVVTGAAASLLSQNPQIYNMPRNRKRSDAIEELLFENCTRRGFGKIYEGRGMPDPGKV